jgi:hypothetical protein
MMTSPRLVEVQEELHRVRRCAELVASSLNALRATRTPTLVASAKTLEDKAEFLLNEQLRLTLEISDLVGPSASSEHTTSTVSPPSVLPVEQPAPKKSKMQGTAVAGFVFLHDSNDPSRRAPLQGPKWADTASPVCKNCGRNFKTV